MFDENCFFSRGAQASRQSSACDPGPRWAWGHQPRARVACPPTAPGGQGGPGRTPEQSLHPLPQVGGGHWQRVRAALVLVLPVGRGVAPAARQSGMHAPGPRIPWVSGDARVELEPPYPMGGRGRTLRSGAARASPAHQGAGIEHVALAHLRSSPCPPGAGDVRV